MTSVATTGALIEVIVGAIRNKRRVADVSGLYAARRRREPAREVQPLDEGGHTQSIAALASVLSASPRNEQPE